MIKLFQASNDRWGVPSPSPFCMKVETYLRMTGVPFVSVRTLDVAQAPKGKLPFIEDDDGQRLADSQLIIDMLKTRYGDRLDEGMTDDERTISHLVRRTFEEGLYFVVVYERWREAGPWDATRDLYFRDAPAWAEPARASILDILRKQGAGRHTLDEVVAMGAADVAAAAAVLGRRPFMLGERPRSLDATVYSFLANILDVPMETKLAAVVRGHGNLVDYASRMRDAYYGETTPPT